VIEMLTAPSWKGVARGSLLTNYNFRAAGWTGALGVGMEYTGLVALLANFSFISAFLCSF